MPVGDPPFPQANVPREHVTPSLTADPYPLEAIPSFIEETRQSIQALAQGHNDLKETIEDVLAIHTILLKAAETQLATAKLLQAIVERQDNESTTNEPDNPTVRI